jgi:hypothetical protein
MALADPEFVALESQIYSQLPKHRTALAGRQRCRRLTEIAIEEFDPHLSAREIREKIRTKAKNEYGSAILLLFLAPLIGELVRLLLKWWLERSDEEATALLAKWQEESRG